MTSQPSILDQRWDRKNPEFNYKGLYLGLRFQPGGFSEVFWFEWSLFADFFHVVDGSFYDFASKHLGDAGHGYHHVLANRTAWKTTNLSKVEIPKPDTRLPESSEYRILQCPEFEW